eukprot:scaffold1803_cov92-Amphora_coffeaeformis.AAC.83
MSSAATTRLKILHMATTRKPKSPRGMNLPHAAARIVFKFLKLTGTLVKLGIVDQLVYFYSRANCIKKWDWQQISGITL